MANRIIPQHSEVPEEYTWNLKDLYESGIGLGMKIRSHSRPP